MVVPLITQDLALLGSLFLLYIVQYSVGTFIDQGEAPEFYFQKYPENNPVLGFFTWRWVLTLGFDHMFSSPIFLGLLALLAASLMACTYTTQIPLVKVARRSNFLLQCQLSITQYKLQGYLVTGFSGICRWNFLYSTETIRKQEFSETLPRASIQDLAVVLMGAGYEVLLSAT